MQFEENTPVVLWCHFLKLNSEEATIVGTPTITIMHYDGSSVVTDVSATSMTQATGTLYYYEWAYATWQTRSYVAKFAATYSDGTAVKESEVFTIIKKKGVGGGINIWTSEEKDKILKEIENIKQGLTQLVSLDDIKKITQKLQDNIDKIIIMVRTQASSELPAKLINELNKIKQSVSELEKSDDLQGKLLANMADLSSIEKVLSEVENGAVRASGSSI